jgi:hypothetical protein
MVGVYGLWARMKDRQADQERLLRAVLSGFIFTTRRGSGSGSGSLHAQHISIVCCGCLYGNAKIQVHVGLPDYNDEQCRSVFRRLRI